MRALASILIVVCLASVGRAQSVGVYDADNQFMGILVGSAPFSSMRNMTIYVPSAKRLLDISQEGPPVFSYEYFVDLLYTDSQCKSGPYTSSDDFDLRLVIYVAPGHRYAGRAFKVDRTDLQNGKMVRFNSKYTYVASKKEYACVAETHTARWQLRKLSPVTLPFKIPVKGPTHFDLYDPSGFVYPLN